MKNENEVLIGVGIGLVFVTLFVGLLALWTDRSLDFWCTYIKGSEVNVPYWLSLIVTLVGNGLVVVGNALTEVLRLRL